MASAHDTFHHAERLCLPLLLHATPERVVAWRHGTAVTVATLLQHVQRVAEQLPAGTAVVNLCEDRYAFLVAFCAISVRGQTNLLPTSRARRAVDDVMHAHPGCHVLSDVALDPEPPRYIALPELEREPSAADPFVMPSIPAEQVVAIGYTSGSTGVPSANAKTWGSLHASCQGNWQVLSARFGPYFSVVATVPPQHMYGLEMSVLLPLLGAVGVDAGRPFLPADIATALAAVPAPRVLITTPVHLRALVASGIALPELAAVVSATAPLPIELAHATEQRFGAPLLELFGATETCVFASRQPTFSEDWSLYDGVQLQPQPDGTVVTSPALAIPVMLADIISLATDGRRFQLRGRCADLLEIAGKRASLGDLTRRLLAIPGVRDGVMFQLDSVDTLGVQRIAALAVAPGLSEQEILAALRLAVDPVFLPRPLRLVDQLPRNDMGKLPRAAQLALLQACAERETDTRAASMPGPTGRE